jgi:hypothetical protein
MPTNKSSDQLVDAKAILEGISELKRHGIDSVMDELEAIERELASFVMEELSLIHEKLIETGASAKVIRTLIGQIESMTLVSILALRKALHRLLMNDGEEDPPANRPASSPPDSDS